MSKMYFLPFRPAFDSAGITVPGSQHWFTVNGTNTPSAPFTDVGLTTRHTNPVVANGIGYLPPIYLDSGVSYRVRIYDADAEVGVDVPLEEYDPYIPALVDTEVLAALSAPWQAFNPTPPASTGDTADISTAFDGDLSNVRIAIEHRISGTATLGQPTSGYQETPETAATFIVSRNSSGWNQSTSGNGGRTAAIVSFTKLENIGGQGDHIAHVVNGFVNGARAGATDFLANPGICQLAGTMTAGADGVYIQGSEVDLQPLTFDAAAIGHVVNITRTAGDTVGGLGAYCAGFRSQSHGAKEIDSHFSGYGLTEAGLDLSPSSYTATKAGIVVGTGIRYYGNAASSDNRKATSLGTDWFNRSASGWDFTFNNVLAFRLSDGGFGYPTGVGGAVTQSTSKSTAVTLNKVTGQITLHNASLAAGASVSFTLNNSLIAATDEVDLWIVSGAAADSYHLSITAVGSGTCRVQLRNFTGGALGEALVLGFSVKKGANA